MFPFHILIEQSKNSHKKMTTEQSSPPLKNLTLLVISANNDNYYRVFEQVLEEYNDHPILSSFTIKVEQAAFDEVQVISYSDSGVIVELQQSRQPIPNTKQDTHRTIKPNFVLIRNIAYGPHDSDFRNVIYGLMHGQIGSVNSLESIYCSLQRPVVHAELRKIEKELGHDQFPLIEQNYYSNCRDLNFVPPYPIILKVAHVHAGLGKMKLEDDSQLQDIKSILQIHGTDYSTAEHYVTGDYDIRIQKIGDHYRAYKRINCHGWKGNVGSAVLEDIPMTPRYKLWADKASKMFGGMEILAVDVLVEQDTGKEYILEVNDTSIGLGPTHAEEDMRIMGKLVLDKMWLRFKPSAESDNSSDKTNDTVDSDVQLINVRNDLMEAQEQIKRLERQQHDSDQKYKELYNYVVYLKNREWKRVAAISTGVVFVGVAAAAVKQYIF
jgi:hypothetical protein